MDVGVDDVAHRITAGLDAFGIEKLAVEEGFAKAAGAGDDLGGDGLGVVVEVACDDAGDAVAFE